MLQSEIVSTRIGESCVAITSVAVALGAPEGDWDEVTDEAIDLFGVPIRPESFGFDALIRRDIRRAGVEIREGVSDPDMGHPWGWAFTYTWFRRAPDGQGTEPDAAVSDSEVDTPLCDLIAAYVVSRSAESWTRFLDAFRKAQVGVVAVGVPAGVDDELVSTADRPISVGLTRHAGGRPMALAFADPEAF